MAPKKARAKSPAPKGGAKAKATPKAEPEPDPKALIEKEAQEMFEKYGNEVDGEGGEKRVVVALKDFANCIRDMNIKKCMIWGEDPGQVIRDQWKVCGGNVKRELTKDGFVTWWPSFLELVQVKVDAMAEAEKAKAAEVAAKSAVYDIDGLWPIPVKQLAEAIEKAFQKGKTALVLDNTDGHRSEVYFTYSNAHIIECKKMIMDKAKGGSVDEILQEVRESFWKGNCFKYGSTVLFRLSNTAMDVKKTFHNETFPTRNLLDAKEVKSVLGPDNAANFKGGPFYKMCMTDDQRTEHECMGANEKFRVAVVSHFKAEEYEEFLKDLFPLELMQPINLLAE